MRADRGFTLLEVLVAFAIAAFATSFMFRATFDGLHGAALSARYQEAVARARSHLAAIGSAASPGDRQGDEGNGFHWHVRIAPIASAILADRRRATLLSVSVAVSWDADPERSDRRSVELDSERLVIGGAQDGP
jgi:general secretion pathway protein I